MNLKQEYEKWMENGRLPKGGLCNSLMGTKYRNTLKLFGPSCEELYELFKEDLSNIFWGSGLSLNDNDRHIKFTPLRQTIVLLILAMHNEL